MGILFSDTSNNVTQDQLISKRYIDKDVNDLNNYYTKNYINDNYITNSTLDTRLNSLNSYKKDDVDNMLKNYQTKGEYALKTDIPNMNNYQTKGNYVVIDDLNKYQTKGDYALKTDLPDTSNYQTKGNYVTVDNLKDNYLNNYQIKGNYVTDDILKDKLINYQTKGEYALKSDLPNLSNYQIKGNYMAYSNDNKDQLDFENEFLTIRDKNKKPLMMFGNETNIYNNTFINGELNIGEKGNYMNLKKDPASSCLVIGTVIDNKYSPVTKWCANSSVMPSVTPTSTYQSDIALPINVPVSNDVKSDTSNMPVFYSLLENYTNIIPNLKNPNWKTTVPFFNKFEDVDLFATTEITTSNNDRKTITLDTTDILNLPFRYLFVFFTVGGTKTNIEMLASNAADLNATSTNNITMDFTYTTSLSNGAINLMETSNIKKNTMNTKNMPIYVYKVTIPELVQYGKFLTFRLISADGNISTLRFCDIIGSNTL